MVATEGDDISIADGFPPRVGWENYDLGNDCSMSFPSDVRPSINWKHIDGPYLSCRDGTLHWLTWLERFALCFWLITVDDLDKKYGNYHKYRRFT